MSILTALNRAQFDEYFFDVAKNIFDILNASSPLSEMFYANLLTDLEDFKIINQSNSDLIVLMVQEFPTDVLLDTTFLDFLKRLSQSHKKLICITTVADATSDFSTENLHYVHSGFYFLHQKTAYLNLMPQREKTFSSDYHWISLSNSLRPHRFLASMIISGSGYDRDRIAGDIYGLLKIAPWPYDRYQNCAHWYTDTIRLPIPDFWPVIETGAQLIQNGFSGGQSINLHNNPMYEGNNNVANFDLLLRDLYKNTTVEIINETTFFNKGVFITEKFLNSVYGYNLPIIISNAGTVAHLKQIGFDLFDDVIDHSYDKVVDPVQRIYSAITCNRRLLTDRDYAIDVWNRCRSRMDRNIDFAKTQMYDHFKNQCLTDFTSLLQKLGY